MRTLLTLLVALALLCGGMVWWTGRQSARLPGWYLEGQAAEQLQPDLETAAQDARQSLVGRFGRELIDEVTADDGTPDESFLDRIKRRGRIVLDGLREGREVRLDARDLERVLLATAYETESGRELLAATRAVRAEFVGDELELGAVLVPAELPESRLPAAQQRLLEVLLGLVGSDGELYVSLRAIPSAVDDRLLFGPPIRLGAGELRIASTLLAILGIEARALETGLVLDVGRVKVRQAAIDGETLILVVSPDI